LEPTKEQEKGLLGTFEFRIEGKIGDESSCGLNISAKSVYARTRYNKHWSDDIAESILICEPQDLEITQFLSATKPATDGLFGTLVLTPSILLSPSMIYDHHPNGEIKAQIVRELLFPLDSGPVLKFEKQFSYEFFPGAKRMTENLAATFKEQIPLASLPEVISDLDDFLLLVSFADRHRCVCNGWTLGNDQLVTQHYRRNVVVPPKSEHSVSGTLIDLVHAKEFLTSVYRKFKDTELKDLIRHGFYGTLGGQDRTMERAILSMFAGLESLTLFFRKESNFELILAESEWKEFENGIKAWMKGQSTLKHSAEVRNLVYGKLKELNRPSFSEVFKRFVDKYQINVSDLWPVTGHGSLLDIRNRIIHGEIFSRAQEWAMSTAVQNLHWLLEKILLTILGWPIEKSRVSPTALRFMCAYMDWREDKEVFS